MKRLPIGILGSGKGNNCCAILKRIRSGDLAAETVTGCTVHYVDERIDHGQILAQREVRILPNDTAESLHARIQVLEHELYPAVIAEFCERYNQASQQVGGWPDK